MAQILLATEVASQTLPPLLGEVLVSAPLALWIGKGRGGGEKCKGSEKGGGKWPEVGGTYQFAAGGNGQPCRPGTE